MELLLYSIQNLIKRSRTYSLLNWRQQTIQRRQKMNQNKINALRYVGSPHTMQGVTHDCVEVKNASEPVLKCITKNYVIKNADGSTKNVIRLNPNNLGGGIPILSYSKFTEALSVIFEETGINSVYWNRVDFRLDSDDPNHFEAYFKLHKLLISCLSFEYNIDNNYTANELFSGRRLNIAIKGTTIETESYDKAAQSKGKDMAAARLEERSIKLRNKDIKHEFCVTWIERWRRAISNFNEVQARFNNELEQQYKADLAKPKRERDYISLTAFLMAKKDSIFTKRQLIDLLSRFEEVSNPNNRATDFKRKHAVEFFSFSNLKQAVNEIEKATLQFFNN